MSLLSAADPQKKLNVRIINTTRLVLDNDSFQTVSQIDFTNEVVLGADDAPAAFVPPAVAKASRKSGKYQVVVEDETVEGYTLKEVLGACLKALDRHRPGTLEKLARIKTTTKRIVARDPANLFQSPELAQEYGHKLENGWWYGTNNSTQETIAWLRRATECSGLEWGVDVRTTF